MLMPQRMWLHARKPATTFQQRVEVQPVTPRAVRWNVEELLYVTVGLLQVPKHAHCLDHVNVLFLVICLVVRSLIVLLSIVVHQPPCQIPCMSNTFWQ